MTADDQTGWAGILDDGEKILWQGRPDTAPVLRPSHIFTIVFGLFFAGFALFWMIMASQAGGYFWAFGLIHFGVGLGVMLGPIFWPAWSRRHTWYTLTDRRAFIATDIPMMGRRLKSYPIEAGTALEFDDSTPGSLYFATEYRTTKNGSRQVPIGFERIADGNKVYRLVRDIQKGIA